MRALDREIELLRVRAQAALQTMPRDEAADRAPAEMADAMRLVEELRVYQTELEIQNQDLRAAQLQTEVAMKKYRRLFENLPLEGLIIDTQGFIVEANAVARKRFALRQSASLQRRSVYQIFQMESRPLLHAALVTRRDLTQASKCQLIANDTSNKSEVDAHIIALNPSSAVDDERLMVLVDRTFEHQLAIKHEEMTRSEERYRALFDGSKVPTLLVDPETDTIVRGNQAAQHFFGYDDLALRAMPLATINHLSAQEIQEEIRRAAAAQREHLFLTHRLADGTTVPVEVHSGPIEIDGRTLLYAIIHDISARVQAQQQADAAHKLLATLTAQVPGLIYQYQQFPDGHSCFPFASPGISDIFEVTPEQVAHDASAAFSVIHPDDLDEVQASIKQSAASLTPWTCEYRVVLPKQGQRWRRGIARPEAQTDGSILWHGFISDITVEHRIQATLEENDRILRTAIDALDEAFVLYDPQDRLVFCNEKYKAIYSANSDLIAPGVTFEQLLRAGAQRGQYVEANGRIEAWVAERLAAHRSGNVTLTQKISTGQVLRVLERRTTDGYTVGFRVDVSAFAQATEAAVTANREYRNLLSAASEVSIIATDRDGLIQLFNRGAERMLGYPADEVMGKMTMSALHLAGEIDQSALELSVELGHTVSGFKVFTEMADRDIQKQREWTYARKDGGHLNVALMVSAVRAMDDEITGYLAIAQDITQRKQAEAKTRLAASVFTHAREGILIADQDCNIIDVNEAFSRITGYSRDEVIGCNPKMLQSGRHNADYYAQMWHSLGTLGHWEGELWNRRKDGVVFPEMLSISAVSNAEKRVLNYVALFTDISMQKEHEHKLERIARYDVLTGLPNRALLADRLQQEMAHCRRQRKQLAVVFIDLDGFKHINDQYGHDVGDELLIALSQRMQAALRDGDTLSRIGGDEFVAILTGLSQPKDCESIMDRLLQAAAEPVEASGFVLHVSASIGVTLFPQDATDADNLMRHADHAMYQAKQAGKNRYHYFDVRDQADVKTERESVDEISRAMDNDEFVLYYQPKVNMKTGKVVGMEALLRWHHPKDELILPGQFLPVIKGHPLSIRLGDWVIRTAVCQMAQWNSIGMKMPVSVNIDAVHLQDPSFDSTLTQILAQHPQVQPAQLVLEVLATSSRDDIEKVTAVMHACCELGVGFSLDDFGTGYSSLTSLRKLPTDLMKIDQSFVIGMTKDSDDFVIVEAVMGLAKAFGRPVLAEGVESNPHGELLLAMGCELGQGYGIARAMPAHAVPDWTQNWRPDPSWSIWNEHSHPHSSRELVHAEISHRHWVRDVENCILGNSDSLPPMDPALCELGQWISGQASTRYRDHCAFEVLITKHDSVHNQAQQLIDWIAAERHGEATAGLPVLHAQSNELVAALRQLRVGSP